MLEYYLDNLCIRFCSQLYRQTVGSPMGNNCALLVADLLLYQHLLIAKVKKIGYNINVLQQTACLVVNRITVGNFAFLLNCMPVGRTLDSMMVPT